VEKKMAGENEEGNPVAVSEFAQGFDSGSTATPNQDDANIAGEVLEAPAPKYAQITEDQLNDLMAKAARVDEINATMEKQFGTAFGKMGGMERVLKEMQSGQSVEVTAEDFSGIAEEFGQEYAETQAKDMNKLLAKFRGGASIDPAAIDKMVSDRVAAQTEAMRIDVALDSVVDGNWRDERNSEAFKAWESTQPDDVKQLADSDRLADAKKMLRLFVESKNKPALKPTESTRTKQLQAAIAPKGVGGNPPPQPKENNFAAGFNTGSA
jgi:hypothetical protein